MGSIWSPWISDGTHFNFTFKVTVGKTGWKVSVTSGQSDIQFPLKEICVALHIIYNNENIMYTNTLYRLIKFTKAHTPWYLFTY